MIAALTTRISDAIGNTPMLALRFQAENITIFAKCEFLNPSGSIKDRLAKTILDDAEARGLLKSDSHILECSSGNTGVAFAMQGAVRGYPVTIVISDKASPERRKLIQHFGGNVIAYSGNSSLGVALTREMAASDPRYFLPRQFENPLNTEDHEHTTGPEILSQVPGPIDAFVNGYGTGGTLAGIARALRRHAPATRIFAMEPTEAALLHGESFCSHRIEGIAVGFVPSLLSGVHLDGVIKISSDDATQMAQRLAREFGLLVGMSSGANVLAALAIARQLGPNARVVTLLCDRAERYFSTPLFTAVEALD